MFQFVVIISCLAAGPHWEQPGSLPFYALIRCSCTWIRSLLQAEQAQLSQPLLPWHSAIRHWDVTESDYLGLEYSRNFPRLRNVFDSPHFFRAVFLLWEKDFLSKPGYHCSLSVQRCHLSIQVDNLGPFLALKKLMDGAPFPHLSSYITRESLG